MKRLTITDCLSLQEELGKTSLDTIGDELLFSQQELINLLNKFKSGILTATDLEKIADLLECKDGILFENESTKESIHLISNIAISGFDMATLVEKILLESS